MYLSLKVIAANILGYVNISQKLKVDTLVGVFISIGTDQQLKNLDVYLREFSKNSFFKSMTEKSFMHPHQIYSLVLL